MLLEGTAYLHAKFQVIIVLLLLLIIKTITYKKWTREEVGYRDTLYLKQPDPFFLFIPAYLEIKHSKKDMWKLQKYITFLYASYLSSYKLMVGKVFTQSAPTAGATFTLDLRLRRLAWLAKIFRRWLAKQLTTCEQVIKKHLTTCKHMIIKTADFLLKMISKTADYLRTSD